MTETINPPPDAPSTLRSIRAKTKNHYDCTL